MEYLIFSKVKKRFCTKMMHYINICIINFYINICFLSILIPRIHKCEKCEISSCNNNIKKNTK